MDDYLSPEDSDALATDDAAKKLNNIVSLLVEYFLEKRNLRKELELTNDEEKAEELEWKLKMLRAEESSLHRIESGLQSLLKIP
jgi:hypothetical protein